MDRNEILKAIYGLERTNDFWNSGSNVRGGGKCQSGVKAALRILKELLEVKSTEELQEKIQQTNLDTVIWSKRIAYFALEQRI